MWYSLIHVVQGEEKATSQVLHASAVLGLQISALPETTFPSLQYRQVVAVQLTQFRPYPEVSVLPYAFVHGTHQGRVAEFR